MKKLFYLSFCLLSTLSALPPFELIEDTSGLTLLNPDFADRQTAKIRLQNGLEMLLISDPKADQSGACMAIEAGSWNDPEEYPGMAHFCEHMLFMGTEKYPDENAFFTEVTNFGGSANAYTAPHRTVYMFSSQTAGFLDLLDRFGHFFIDPLFNPANIAREMHAVDQEFAKSLENDYWRSYMVMKEIGNPEHPNHLFSCGNSETLAHIPQSALQKWHQEHYGASQMHLVLYSSLPLSELKTQAILLFAEVPSGASKQINPEIPLTSAKQQGQIIYIQPIQNRQVLTLSWEIPPALSSEPSQTADVLAYALNRGQKYSLYEKLKDEQLIDHVSVRMDEAGGKEHRFFQISFSLTDKGLKEIKTVTTRAFQALASFKKTGIPSYFVKERNKMAELTYQYQSRQDAFSYLQKLGETLPDEPLETYPREQLLSEALSGETVARFLLLLTPETCSVTLLAPLEDRETLSVQKEKWMGAEYATGPIPKEWIQAWGTAEPHPDIRIAEPNPYLPTSLAILPREPQPDTPILISKAKMGTAYYARCPEYAIPEAIIQLHILSPQIQPNAKSFVLSSLYIDHITDVLMPTLSCAASAHLSSSFSVERNRLSVKVSGFSEKVPYLLQEILRQMPQNPPTREQFQVYIERHRKGYQNASKELAYKQGKEALDALLCSDKIPAKEKLSALETVRYEEFLVFHKKLFQSTFIEALFTGNLSMKEAESTWLDIIHAIGKTPYIATLHPQTKILQLPAKGPYSVTESLSVQGNAALLTLDEGPFSFENRAAQEVLNGALKEAFFNTLRTKQKTGYIAFSDGFELEGRLFHLFLVQSNSHQPQDLLFRFELFLEDYLESFEENISRERFETLRKSVVEKHKTRFRNLKEKSALWDMLAFEKGADFAYMEKRIQTLETLDYDTLKECAQEFLSRANRKRLALLMEGKLSDPFAYEPLTFSQLKEVADFASPTNHPPEEAERL